LSGCCGRKQNLLYLLERFSSIYYFIIKNRPTVEQTEPSVQMYGGFLLGIKRSGREIDHTPSSRSEAQNQWCSKSSSSSISLHNVGRDKFNFLTTQYPKLSDVYETVG
jgi:hypothetical protein